MSRRTVDDVVLAFLRERGEQSLKNLHTQCIRELGAVHQS